ncbi:class I SAM-dependent methyltransferase [Rubrobacter aplysinae]|uniref:class I SAM-dependent methyltransferase n=1 Tax=Rubrobacter aplysinae TaxID=909625 RepID=UPI00064BA200|nr:class I SAM-dependent methyltransferase [Rubrobacter aplysinae]
MVGAGDWAASEYDRSAGYVSRLGEDVVDLLDPRLGERVLDLGCGTGDLSAELSSRGAEVLGVDLSPEMVSRSAEKYPALRFEAGDARSLGLRPESFDAVFSNATLHWIKEASKAIRAVRRVLRPGGRFVAELGGRGNVRTIERAIEEALAERVISSADRNPWYFPSLAEYAGLLEEAGFEVRYAVLFDRPTPLGEEGIEGWLRVFAGSFFEGLSEEERGEITERVVEKARPGLSGEDGLFADYRRLRVSAVKV